MGFRTIEIAVTLILYIIHIHCAYCAEHILPCNVTVLEPCPGNNQICNETTHECVCMRGYVLFGEDCMVPDDSVDTAHYLTTSVVTIFTLALVICGLYLVIRKYDLIEYIGQKINMRRNNDVMYEDVMIGQDDPPLSP